MSHCFTIFTNTYYVYTFTTLIKLSINSWYAFKKVYRLHFFAGMVVPELRRVGAPACFIILIVLLGFHNKIPQQVDLQYVELFSGQGCISLAMAASGFTGSSHDIAFSDYMDLASTAGFLFLGSIQRRLFITKYFQSLAVEPPRNSFSFNICFAILQNKLKPIAMLNLGSTGYKTVVCPPPPFIILAAMTYLEILMPHIFHQRQWESKRNTKVISHVQN